MCACNRSRGIECSWHEAQRRLREQASNTPRIAARAVAPSNAALLDLINYASKALTKSQQERRLTATIEQDSLGWHRLIIDIDGQRVVFGDVAVKEG
jgi:hypothetical protein